MANNTSDDELNALIRNFVYSGLSLEQMNSLPKWFITNLDKNVPSFKESIKQREEQAALEARLDEVEIEFLKYSLDTDVDESILIQIRNNRTIEIEQLTTTHKGDQ